jgi:hypothetical protein
MGFNHQMIGYATVQEMFEAFQRSERAQLEGMFRFIEARSLVEPIRRRDFLAFAAATTAQATRRPTLPSFVNNWPSMTGSLYQRRSPPSQQSALGGNDD